MTKKMNKRAHESLSVMAFNVCTCNGCSCGCPDIPTHQVGVSSSRTNGGGSTSVYNSPSSN